MIAPEPGFGSEADRQPAVVPWDGSRRLWSLWKMLEFNASAFYHLNAALMSPALVGFQHASTGGKSQDEHIQKDFRDFLYLTLKEQIVHLSVLNAQVTLLAAKETMIWLTKPQPITVKRLVEELDGLKVTLRRELSTIHLYVLEGDKQRYYDQKQPLFGNDFAVKFSSAAFELDEAAKCLALGRSTASVFHLMRMMEIGVRAVAQCLGVPDPVKPSERNWGNMLKAIWTGIEQKWPTVTSRATGDGAVFEALYASLNAVKNPWRNATMHVENKYTDDEAEHIFVAVRGFMMKLAPRCDEDGNPKA